MWLEKLIFFLEVFLKSVDKLLFLGIRVINVFIKIKF